MQAYIGDCCQFPKLKLTDASKLVATEDGQSTELCIEKGLEEDDLKYKSNGREY